MKDLQPHLLCFGLGYTGKVLAHRLLEMNWRVSGTVRDLGAVRQSIPDGVAVLPFGGQSSETEQIAKALQSATHVLSTVPTGENGDPVIAAMKDELAENANLEWVGYLSTTGVYGNTGGTIVDETTPTNPSGDRGARRVKAENQWSDLFKSYGLPVHIFRLPGIYGPGRSVLDQIRHGKPRRILKPGHKFNRIHVDDIAETLIASMARPNPGSVYNVCDNTPAEPSDVTAYACKLMEIEPPPLIPFEEVENSMSPMGRSFWHDNRRVSNELIKSELGVQLRYPNYKVGLDAIWKTENE